MYYMINIKKMWTKKFTSFYIIILDIFVKICYNYIIEDKE